jgi:FAD dependent oxidoreductase TIGR03364
MPRYDVAVVGAGILGLSHALAAARRGLRVVVIDRDQRANGASIRNFGFITVTGQQRGACWHRAMRSRDIWADLAPKAGIRIEHAGLAVVARRPEAADVLAAFRKTEMGDACKLLGETAARTRFPHLTGPIDHVLWSPHDLRVESRDAIPKLATFLERDMGVAFLRGAAVQAVTPPHIQTTGGTVTAEYAVVCPGDDLSTLYPDRLAEYGVRRCKLQMMRLMPRAPLRLDGAVMTDLSLVRYLGYAELPEAAALHARLTREQPAHLAGGVHLIVVQSADGSLVVGDTHVYGDTLDPFAEDSLDRLVLEEFEHVFPDVPYDVRQRWTGTYASLDNRLVLIDRPQAHVRLVVVTSGTGASTGFAIGEDVIKEMLG